jgi:hypothetical protein
MNKREEKRKRLCVYLVTFDVEMMELHKDGLVIRLFLLLFPFSFFSLSLFFFFTFRVYPMSFYTSKKLTLQPKT